MAYVLTGTRYIGTGSLPTPVVGYDAVDTSTGNIYAANTSATAWNQIGNVNSANLGLVPITGAAMTGPLDGATGWAPLDAPNFTTSAKLGGVDLATTADLASNSTTILNSIAPKITEAVAATSAGITVKSNIARATGKLHFTTTTPQTIPLPTYPDGTTADEADCKWFVGLIGTDGTAGVWGQGWPCGRSDSNGDMGLIYSADPTSTRTFAVYLRDRSGVVYPTTIMYYIEGVRS